MAYIQVRGVAQVECEAGGGAVLQSNPCLLAAVARVCRGQRGSCTFQLGAALPESRGWGAGRTGGSQCRVMQNWENNFTLKKISTIS